MTTDRGSSTRLRMTDEITGGNMIALDSDHIIEAFSHSKVHGENDLGVCLVLGSGTRPPGNKMLLFVSEQGIEPIKKSISDARDILRQNGRVAENLGQGKLNLATIMPPESRTYYYDMEDAAARLGFALMIPEGFEIKIHKREMIRIFSRIFNALTFNTRGWS